MRVESKNFLSRIAKGPAFLLLGQDTLRFETGRDFLLEEVVRKFGNAEKRDFSYSDIFLSSAISCPEQAVSWMAERCNRLITPEWLRAVAGFQWSGVYSSGIDDLILKCFQNDWRHVRCILDGDTNFPDMRNRKLLTCTFLFGCVISEERDSRPPLSKKELNKRNITTSLLLKRLPELISPMGTLAIEGYAGTKDWLRIAEQLEVIIDELEPGQAHLFSATNELISDFERETELISTGKLILHKESLAECLSQGEREGYIQLGKRPEEEVLGHRVIVNKKAHVVPTEIWNAVSPHALIVDELLFSSDPKLRPDEYDKKYQEFRTFLSESSTVPVWSGFREDRGFAFERDYEIELWSAIQKKLDEGTQTDAPIILYGQAGSGKTIALGSIVFKLYKQEKYPILFIERKVQLPSEESIDRFCKWAENNGAEGAIIIWDGMIDIEKYNLLLRFLNGRGRKPVLLIGSSYMQPASKFKRNNPSISLIRAEAKLNRTPVGEAGSSELERFKVFLGKVEKGMDEVFAGIEENDSFLVSLYRWLPATRRGINEGLKEEVRQAVVKIQELGKTTKIDKTLGSLAVALQKHEKFKNWTLMSVESQEVGEEEFSDAEMLFGLVLIPGSFGLSVPFDLLVRALGKVSTAQYLKLLDNTDLFRYGEDEVGNLFLSVREVLEAALIVNSGKLALCDVKLEFVRSLIINMSNSDLEVQFVIELLKCLGPNNKKNMRSLPGRLNPWPIGVHSHEALRCYHELAEMLAEVRENHFFHPKLALQEATLLRESLLGDKCEFDCLKTLEQAENVLRTALERDTEDNKRQRLSMFVELASVIGTKINFLGERNLKEDKRAIIELFNDAKLQLKEARKIDPAATYPAATLSWIVPTVIKQNILSEMEILSTITEVLKVFESIEGENLSEVSDYIFHKKKLEFGELVERQDISERAFADLKAQGSCDGYFFISKKLFPQTATSFDFTSEDKEKCYNAWKYLEDNRAAIKSDSACLIRLLRLFWMNKTNMPLFFREGQVLPFNKDDWKYCELLLQEIDDTGKDCLNDNPSILYLKGIVNFHCGNIRGALDVFSNLSHANAERAFGRNRNKKFYFVTDEAGKAKLCRGYIDTIERDKGWVKIQEYKGLRVPFLLRDYYGIKCEVGRFLEEMYIAFNFRGLILTPKYEWPGK